MDPEQAAIVLALSTEEVLDLAAAIGANPDEGFSPEDLVAMAALVDADADEEEGEGEGEDEDDADDE